ncbi:hypothetical protein [Streptomyces sp. B21-101]|uniref:hypothetical protein n=1 Tax=Streptomyces sp. B21-101 TaxID=3039415 RepID=UPI002FF3AC7C
MSSPDPAWTITAWERGVREGTLDRAVTLLASATGLSRDQAESADVGSRDAVLVDVLSRFTGGVVQACVRCTGCGEQLDVPLDLTAFPRTPWREPGALLEAEVSGLGVRFRLPSTGDLRLLRGRDAVAGRLLLLARCVQAEAGRGEDLDEETAAAVEAAMEEAAPGGAVTVHTGCPDCGVETAAALDIPALLWAEVQTQAVALLHQVHVLATAYGWTEPEVLALSPARRAAYLELVSR